MVVSIGDIRFVHISEGVERDTEEALRLAYKLKQRNDFTARGAVVHRYDGLLLLDDVPEKSVQGYHFQTPICGYSGNGPRTASIILEMFGFGRSEDLYATLSSREFCQFTVR